MRKQLSRVEAVFQIAERGCIVCPGIPRNSESLLKIGDRLWLERPDGSQASTIVRGIEMGGADNSPGIPILLGAELTKHEIPVGTQLLIDFSPTETFTIHTKAISGRVELNHIFEQDETSCLRFGRSGKSKSVATTTDIQKGPIEFTDYLMESLVTYHMQAVLDTEALTVIVAMHGTSRDPYLRSHVTFHLKQAGCIVSE